MGKTHKGNVCIPVATESEETVVIVCSLDQIAPSIGHAGSVVEQQLPYLRVPPFGLFQIISRVSVPRGSH